MTEDASRGVAKHTKKKRDPPDHGRTARKKSSSYPRAGVKAFTILIRLNHTDLTAKR